MSGHELFEQMIENRLFIESMDLDLLKKSSSVLKNEYLRRLNANVFSFLNPDRKTKEDYLHK